MDSIADDGAFDFEELPWGALGRSVTLGCVSLCSQFVMHVLNTTTVHNEERYTSAVTHRETGVGLITVSNHTR